jgi:hypothetical protein
MFQKGYNVHVFEVWVLEIRPGPWDSIKEAVFTSYPKCRLEWAHSSR